MFEAGGWVQATEEICVWYGSERTIVARRGAVGHVFAPAAEPGLWTVLFERTGRAADVYEEELLWLCGPELLDQAIRSEKQRR